MADRHHVSIHIAGIAIDLDSPLDVDALGIEPRLGAFFAAPDAAPPLRRVRLRWEECEGEPVPRGDLVYDPGSVWRLYKDGTTSYALLHYGCAPATALLQANEAWDDLVLRERRPRPPGASLLALGAGELIVRVAASLTGALVLHSSGLDDNGRGIVFVGHSGAGKSTQAMLWAREPGVVAMNDDRILVRLEHGVPTCYGMPWGGTADIARNHHVPLQALVLLEQAPVNEIAPVAPVEALSLLAARSFLPYWDEALTAGTLASLASLLSVVKVFRLRCRPERAVVPLVRAASCWSPTTS